MRILYLTDGMFNAAGRERVVTNKATYLSKMGHQVTIATTDQHERPAYYPLPPAVQTVNLDINYTDYNGKGIVSKAAGYLRKSRLFKLRLHAFLDSHPQDVVVALMDRYLPAMLSYHAPIVTVYENHFNKYAMYALRESRSRRLLQQAVYRLKDWYYAKVYYRRLSIFAVLTKEDKAYWGTGFSNIVWMPNSINYQQALRAPLNNKIAISVGRLTYQKGYDRLLAVWRLVAPKHPDWQLHIYGSGEDKEQLTALIKEYSLNNVRLFPPTPDLEKKLTEASLYVMTSRFEGLPMVLLESMAVGLPLVSFDCMCGPRDVIRDEQNGFLIPDGDLSLMAERISLLMDDEQKRRQLGRQAKADGEAFSHEHIIEQWISLFNSKASL